jgi:hypothetical protein
MQNEYLKINKNMIEYLKKKIYKMDFNNINKQIIKKKIY